MEHILLFLSEFYNYRSNFCTVTFFLRRMKAEFAVPFLYYKILTLVQRLPVCIQAKIIDIQKRSKLCYNEKNEEYY